jgi:hypothetical protein
VTDISADGWDFLQKLRDRYAERGEQDRPDYLVHAVGDDGSVQIRPLTWDDIVAWANRECRGEVG